jgi:O-antigen/teichoic acid export membrane protein
MSAVSLRTMLGSAMGLRLAMAGLNYGLFWLLSHQLPAEQLGAYSVLMNVFLLVQLLPLLGLNVPLVRRVAADHACASPEMSNALAFSLPVALLISGIVWAFGRWSYPESMHLPFGLVALVLWPTAWTLVAESTLLGMERMTDIVRVQTLEVVLRVACAWAAVRAGWGLDGVFAALLALRWLSAVLYLRLPGLPRPRRALISHALWRRNLSEVPMFLGIALLAAFSARLDVIVLSHLRPLAEVGVYAAAARLYDASLMLPTVAALVMMPTLARLFANDLAQFRTLFLRALGLGLGGGMLVALAVAALAGPLIGWLYKPSLAGAAPVLRWLIFGAVFMMADQILSSTMMAAKAQRQDMLALARALVVLALALALFGWWLGPIGAAMAVALALALRVQLRLRWAMRALEMPGLQGLWLRQLLAAAAGLSGLLLGLSLPSGALAAWAMSWLAWGLAARALGVLPADWWRRAASEVTLWLAQRRGARS